MPIRFRCVYCDKLLGIATRKAGTVVNCPQCGQPLIVPSPEPQVAPAGAAVQAPPSAAPPPGGLFEQDDFDVVLATDAMVQAPPPPPRPSPARTQTPPQAPLPARQFAVEQSLPTPSFRAPAAIPLSGGRGTNGLVLTPIKLIIGIVAVFFLMGIAFGGGILVGRMLN
jgi:hypothetical protein